ncbi:unnamed protein product (macronuclear) [Paramecium tetraurelia]|uniref:Uncharacterized protein n=1 Tax=Paramecium tetraurelia TaxID=5888 RepID=A0ED63_PARTE|nr:uncharacterized protein GSPATT00004099001 [Paramecium tetraurelia]CAK93230.1 unnamed protein product [Paramecium tetraurelia]|eukprot:XP_001460627.1 hypothetical protein (macronuclear) [Paramecium tetraurelia strain d4-2]
MKEELEQLLIIYSNQTQSKVKLVDYNQALFQYNIEFEQQSLEILPQKIHSPLGISQIEKKYRWAFKNWFCSRCQNNSIKPTEEKFDEKRKCKKLIKISQNLAFMNELLAIQVIDQQKKT